MKFSQVENKTSIYSSLRSIDVEHFQSLHSNLPGQCWKWRRLWATRAAHRPYEDLQRDTLEKWCSRIPTITAPQSCYNFPCRYHRISSIGVWLGRLEWRLRLQQEDIKWLAPQRWLKLHSHLAWNNCGKKEQILSSKVLAISVNIKVIYRFPFFFLSILLYFFLLFMEQTTRKQYINHVNISQNQVDTIYTIKVWFRALSVILKNLHFWYGF